MTYEKLGIISKVYSGPRIIIVSEGNKDKTFAEKVKKEYQVIENPYTDP